MAEAQAPALPDDSKVPAVNRYSWGRVLDIVREHRRELVSAHVIAFFAVLAGVPLPLMMPLLVDEVLLKEPGFLVNNMDRVFPQAWHGPVLYITTILLMTIALRLVSVLLSVWQTRQFTLISKDVVYRIRRDLLLRLQRISMAEYEAMGLSLIHISEPTRPKR